MNKHEEFDIKNRKIFKEKKLLQLVYGNYFNLIEQNLSGDRKNPILEIGSSGFIKDHIPNCITSYFSLMPEILFGTSNNVYPAAGFIDYILSRKEKILLYEFNLEETAKSGLFTESFKGYASKTLPNFLELVSNGIY